VRRYRLVDPVHLLEREGRKKAMAGDGGERLGHRLRSDDASLAELIDQALQVALLRLPVGHSQPSKSRSTSQLVSQAPAPRLGLLFSLEELASPS
jgi:hypothetical protein